MKNPQNLAGDLLSSVEKMRKSKLLLFAMLFVIATGFAPLALDLLLESDFLTKGQALKNNPLLLKLHILTDVLIGLAYMAIPIILVRMAAKAGFKIPYVGVFFAFGIFIVACGLTHFMGAFITWKPWYYLELGIQYLTALVSIGTAILLVPIVPRVAALVESAGLSEERRRALELSNEQLAESLKNLERRTKEAETLNEFLVEREKKMMDLQKENERLRGQIK